VRPDRPSGYGFPPVTDVGLRRREAAYSAIDRLAEPGELGPWNAFRNTATLDRVLAPAAEHG